MSASQKSTGARAGVVDAVVIGAGFAGLYTVYRLREMGISYRAFEQGGGVGGTWYWNRYPGASSDSESWVYSFTFSKELEQEWTWSCRFPEQPEILRYLEHVADRFDLKSQFDFDTRVSGATYDEAGACWVVQTSSGETVKAKYLITAVGCLSAAQVPKIPGLDQFKGKWYHTGQWPHEGVDFTGKTVGVVGTGSSGIQSIPIIAKQARHLTVFQRTANFSVPARNAPLSKDRVDQLKRDIGQIRETCRWANIGQPYDFRDAEALKVPAAERQQQFEADWQKGGFEWMFGSYKDLLADRNANELAADFVRDKIRSIVKNPDVANKLIPKGYPIGTKRLPLDQNYFETYNRDNVDLVDVRANPIEAIVADGIRTKDQTYKLDAIVFATGFDAMTGPLTRIGIRGRGGQKLEDKWSHGPQTYLGVATLGFPNMFMITGPGSPSVLGNMPTSIEQHVEWICGCISHIQKQGASTIEPTQSAEEHWGQHVKELADATLFPQTDSWYMGANIPGKPRVFLPYIGGFGTYRKLCNEIAEKGYEGFSIR
ncbi:cyclohexanone monooxygenase [Panacagrimonas perspica]|uniref:Cyclohexanone monooxygenase n=1 Tax=Panacagrimonas perspica TaxID=381431 RepID=A0A4R7PEE5_9GAMM|nr:NAD(P)/FAD-dependent oxidoreductase [Panacagrimonas perspica]TDU31951.1 cyclohexanone monooxygenase [Panacagrimonas perspica]THD04279.1 cyclohexanone monooxygenase [Panacagrimonas perspica]